ncbi:MAG: aconitate hydratase AcnA [Atopobiaceae bacterium]|jgi:aconitate hydratase|nr:aconitate hydratase AcnA [Atopobiaceae bacterium]
MADASITEAVANARRPIALAASGIERKVFDVTGIPGADRLPRALVILLENVVRRAADDESAAVAAAAVVSAGLAGQTGDEIEFMPSRVLFQDFTGVPVFADFAAMRDAMVARGGDPKAVNPHIPCTLVIDHSVTADVTGCPSAARENRGIEARKNRERFAFLKWSSKSFDNVEIVPPGGGICHQLNIERFCEVVGTDALAGDQAMPTACFDTLVGTDSHTTTANGIGVLGWGVGGIEAEAAALGQPITMRVPAVVGVRLSGSLRDGISGMDLALTVAQRLRAEGVVGNLVEAFGEGVASLTPTQRACVANMTPEYGATATLFPVDESVLSFLELTGRDAAEISFVRAYLDRQGLLDESAQRVYSKVVDIDLSQVELSLAGPSRPHDRLTPGQLAQRFRESAAAHGHADPSESFEVDCGGESVALSHGAIAIAAVTSCTTATDPAMMIACGLAAKKAVEHGLGPKPWVKKVFAPGSHATEILLERAGLLDGLRSLGFYTCGFGCMSCIGNSGDILGCLKPLAGDMELTSVLSGNRNFEGRISPDVSQNYLCQPALVVAYSLVGTMDVDLSSQPVGISPDGSEVWLSDILPTTEEVERQLERCLAPEVYSEGMRGLLDGDDDWQSIDSGSSDTFAWDDSSTYVRRPPYFEIAQDESVISIEGARCLVRLGDFVTTDHISPAGAIALDSPAARYLVDRGVTPGEFNTYGSRRGNHEVMARGTFANVKLANGLADGRLGGWTTDLLSGDLAPIYDAAARYAREGIPLVVVAGKLYGSGSSRDWAAKGPLLLGVRAVIAESLERIHRSNLIGMGILPLEFADGQTADSLGLDGTETYSIEPVDLRDGMPRRRQAQVTAVRTDGTSVTFACTVRVDTPTEGAYLAVGGILPYVLGQLY